MVIFRKLAFLPLCAVLFLSGRAFSAEIIFLGNPDGSAKSEDNPSYSPKQRALDLFNFRDYENHGEERSGWISGRVMAEYEFTTVDGNKEKSFYRDNESDHNIELNLNIHEKMGGDYNLDAELFLRKTDDRAVEDRAGFRLKQLDVKVANEDNLFEFGDLYADFSNFVLGNSLEGFYADIQPSERYEFKSVIARQYHEDASDGLYQRNVMGFKADTFLSEELEFFNIFRLGAQIASTQDDSSTVDPETSTVDLANTVMSVDGELRTKNGAALLFEVARSIHSDDEEATDAEWMRGTAVRIKPSYRFGENINVEYLFYRVTPDFVTSMGSASRDKQQHQVSVDWKINDKYTFSVVKSNYFDKLNDNSTRENRTIYDDTYLTLNARPLVDRKNMSLRLYLNYSEQDEEDTDDSDSDTTTYGFSLNDKLGETNVGTFFESRFYDDRSTYGKSERFFRYGANASRDLKLFSRRLYLTGSYSGSTRKNESTTDNDYEDGFSFSGQYNWSDALTFDFGHNIQIADNGSTTYDYTTNTSYAEATYRLPGVRNSEISLRCERNDYRYEDNHDDDYRETRAVLSFVSNF